MYTHVNSGLENGCRDCHSAHESPLNLDPTLAREVATRIQSRSQVEDCVELFLHAGTRLVKWL